MSRALTRLGLPLKKVPDRHGTRRGRVITAWRDTMADLDPATVVFPDDTRTQTVMTRRTGRAPRGQRVIGPVLRTHGANVTCLVAMAPDRHAGVPRV